MVPNRDRYQSTFFEKGESLSLGQNMKGSENERQTIDKHIGSIDSY